MTDCFSGVYRGRKVLVTGHTGFKGSWLVLWLQSLGAEVHGVSLGQSSEPDHWSHLGLDIVETRCDIRDAKALADLVEQFRPDMVFHLAAQSLVRRSYADPLETWSTNVMGTVNLLEACRRTNAVKAILSVTSDKCYANHEWHWGYREIDPLGGHDPYSASKAAAEIVSSSYRKSFLSEAGILLATARAGNVIGGGDWSEDRLIPDLVRAVAAGRALEIRSPHATRPWQHVLESLSGYLLLGQRLLEGRQEFADAWNFGPDSHSNLSVIEVLQGLKGHWPELDWSISGTPKLHEAAQLHLDSAKARRLLSWQPVWTLEETLAQTAAWYQGYLKSGQPQSREQLAGYVSRAMSAGLVWAM